MRRRPNCTLAAVVFAWCAFLAGAGLAGAQGAPGAVEVGPFLGGYVFDHDVSLKNHVVFGARGAYWFTQDLAGELSVEGVSTEEHSNGDNGDLFESHLDLLYHLPAAGKLRPFLAAGLGAAHYHADSQGGDDWDFLVNYGIGLKYWFTDRWAARLDLRQPVTFDDTNLNFYYTVGLSYLFGVPAPAPAAAPVVGPVPRIALGANPATIQRGQSSTLTWSADYAREASLDGVGSVDPIGTRTVTPEATTTYRLVAKNDAGASEAQTTVTVVEPPPPAAPTASLTATPASVTQGQSSTLSWSTQNATEASIQGIGPVALSGSQPVAPRDSTTYRLIARGPGGTAESAASVSVALADSDGDGVTDDKDRCPGTPAGTTVDAQGCPLDADKDGVYDYLDKCPGTPAGVAVDGQGCPLDADKDGVPDYLDSCPTTPKGLKVGADGCAVEKLRMGLKIEFDTAKDAIKPEFHDELAKVGDFMKEYPQTNVVIEGHTDSVGGEEYNRELSQRRAEAVQKYLEEKFGIAQGRITSKGYGPTNPVADNATPGGRAQNRRTEAVVDEVIIRK